MSLKGYDIDVADYLAASMGVKMVPVSVSGRAAFRSLTQILTPSLRSLFSDSLG